MSEYENDDQSEDELAEDEPDDVTLAGALAALNSKLDLLPDQVAAEKIRGAVLAILEAVGVAATSPSHALDVIIGLARVFDALLDRITGRCLARSRWVRMLEHVRLGGCPSSELSPLVSSGGDVAPVIPRRH